MSELTGHAASVIDFIRRQRSAPSASLSIGFGGLGLGGGTGGGGGGGGPIIAGIGSIVGSPGDVVAERGVPTTIEDNFANSYIERFWSVKAGTWSESGGELSVTGLAGINVPRGVIVCDGFGDVTNGEAFIYPNLNLNSGVLLRWDDATGSGYFVRRSGATTAQLLRIDSYTPSLPLATAVYSVSQQLGVRATGSTIDLLIDGVVAGTAVDATYASGLVGLGAQTSGSTLYGFSASRF